MKFITALFALILCNVFVALPAHAGPPPAAVYESEPYKSGEFFASATCITQKFDCKKSMTRKETLHIANICASETFGVENLLGAVGPVDSPYVGCAVPTNYESATSASTPLKRKWPVCCVIPKGDSCTFTCHLYYNNR